MRQTICFLAAVFVTLLTSACGGGNSAPQNVMTDATPTPQQVSQGDLPNMVLTLSDLAAPYAAFVLDPAGSGPQTRDSVIKNACDPQRQASELDATGWVAQYNNEFGPATGGSPASDGTFLVTSGVDLFQDDSGAATAFQNTVTETLQWANTSCKGLNISVVQKFDFPTIGDESWGSNVSFTVPGGNPNQSGIVTTVISRRGRVIVNESLVRFGGFGLPDEAVRLARLIIQRMSGSPNL